MQVLLIASKLSILNLCFLIGTLNVSTNVNRVKGKGPKTLLHAPFPAALTSDRALSFLCEYMHVSGARIFMTVEGNKGKFLGSTEEEGKQKDYIEITGYEYDILSQNYPGQASGRRQNKPVTVTKLIDKSTPQFFEALTTNEELKEITIQFFSEYPTTEAHYSITLKNCTIGEIKQELFTERVSISFTEIILNFGEVSAKDSWTKTY